MQLRSWILSSIVILLCAAAAHAAEPRILFAPGEAVTAGELVTVGWQGLPPEVEEFEFLLSTGHGELIRLTPELSPSDGSFQWTIPDLPSREAVLYLRARLDGEEVVVASTEPFVIRAASRTAPVEFRNREWWMVAPIAPPAAVPPVIQPARQVIATEGYLPKEDWSLHVAPVLVHERPADSHRVRPGNIDTHCGAPLVVPQRI
jgi:hypothetical protein